MKPLKSFSTLFLLVACCNYVFAQTQVTTVNDISWSLVPTWANASVLGVGAYYSSPSPFCDGASNGIIKIDNNSIISNIQLDADNAAVIRLNKDLSVQWQTNIDGVPLAIGMLNGNVLTIVATTTSGWKGNGNDYYGFLIDPKTGSLLQKKELFSGDDDGFYQEPVFLFAPDGSFFKLAVRVSNFARKAHNPLLMFNMNKVMGEYFANNAFKLIDFDKDLNPKNTIDIKPEEGYFIGGTANNKGDVFLVTDVSQGFIKVARYENDNPTPSKVLQLPIDLNDDITQSLSDFHLIAGKEDPLSIFMAASYPGNKSSRELAIAKFDFAKGTVLNNVQVMDKDYLKGIEKSYTPFNKKFNSVNLGDPKEMKIKNVVEDNGRLIMALTSYSAKESYGMEGSHSVIDAYDILVNVFDERLNVQFQQIIPRYYVSLFILRLGVGMRLKNNMLYMVLNNNKGILGYKAIYSQIDLKTGAITNVTPIDKKDIKNSYAVEPYSSLWFDDEFVLSYMEDKGWYAKSADAHMQVLTY